MRHPSPVRSVTDSRRAFLRTALAAPLLAAAARRPGPPPVMPPVAAARLVGGEPVRYPDPDIVALDPRFRRYIIGNTPIRRLHTGTLWAEGPAWNGVGRYLVWSDIPNNVQMRWIEEDGARQRRSATRPATATATPSTTRAGSSRASTAAAAWCATSRTARSR